MGDYKSRIVDDILKLKLKSKGAVLIEGPKTLNSFANIIDTTRMKEPSFKMVLTAVGDYAYCRPIDGIYVVPIGCLKP